MKTYMTPSVKELTILNSEMLCVSGNMPISTGEEVTDGWARKGGWKSELWTEEKDDEEEN